MDPDRTVQKTIDLAQCSERLKKQEVILRKQDPTYVELFILVDKRPTSRKVLLSLVNDVVIISCILDLSVLLRDQNV